MQSQIFLGADFPKGDKPLLTCGNTVTVCDIVTRLGGKGHDVVVMGYVQALHVFVETIATWLDTPVGVLIARDPRFAEAWARVLEGHEATAELSERLIRGEQLRVDTPESLGRQVVAEAERLLGQGGDDEAGDPPSDIF